MNNITKLCLMSGRQVITVKDLMAETGMSQRVMDTRLAEIRDECKPGGRYAGKQYVISGGGKFRIINYLIWLDHEFYRVQLAEKNLRKNLPPYNPYRVALETGMYQDKEEMML